MDAEVTHGGLLLCRAGGRDRCRGGDDVRPRRARHQPVDLIQGTDDGPPAAATNSVAASTLGPIDPAGNSSAFSSSGEMASSRRWFGVPHSVYTPSTSVAMMYTSAPS